MNPVFTIGHSNHSIERFAELLRGHAIDAVADVRSQPFSQRLPHYNREPLATVLRSLGIRYVFLGAELGARRSEPEAYEGLRADYDLIAECPAFQRGLARVVEGAGRHRVALLCAEKEPLDCHRCVLVGRRLGLRGVAVQHILDDGRVEDAMATEARLLAMMGLEDPGLFAERDERLVEAYRRRGVDIAYTRDPSEASAAYGGDA